MNDTENEIKEKKFISALKNVDESNYEKGRFLIGIIPNVNEGTILVSFGQSQTYKDSFEAVVIKVGDRGGLFSRKKQSYAIGKLSDGFIKNGSWAAYDIKTGDISDSAFGKWVSSNIKSIF